MIWLIFNLGPWVPIILLVPLVLFWACYLADCVIRQR
jgi:hypothetical protein